VYIFAIMSVNLTKNKESLLEAWEEIHNPNGKNDWVIFGYERVSCDLKVVSQGEDGIEEMVDDLNGGKIQYVGLRIIDPNTSLPKIVFINWQGEGVPATVKGKCANHLRDITNLFRGFHVQINARNEDDVDKETIEEKVKNASGAKFGIHKKAASICPTGTYWFCVSEIKTSLRCWNSTKRYILETKSERRNTETRGRGKATGRNKDEGVKIKV